MKCGQGVVCVEGLCPAHLVIIIIITIIITIIIIIYGIITTSARRYCDGTFLVCLRLFVCSFVRSFVTLVLISGKVPFS